MCLLALARLPNYCWCGSNCPPILTPRCLTSITWCWLIHLFSCAFFFPLLFVHLCCFKLAFQYSMFYSLALFDTLVQLEFNPFLFSAGTFTGWLQTSMSLPDNSSAEWILAYMNHKLGSTRRPNHKAGRRSGRTLYQALTSRSIFVAHKNIFRVSSPKFCERLSI